MSLHVNALLASTWNCTPMITPAGVAAVPWFFTVALNCTGPPTVAVGLAMLVTTRSGIATAADTFVNDDATAPTDITATSGAASANTLLFQPLRRDTRDSRILISASVHSTAFVRVGLGHDTRPLEQRSPPTRRKYPRTPRDNNNH